MTANEPDETVGFPLDEKEPWPETVKRWQVLANQAAAVYNMPIDLHEDPRRDTSYHAQVKYEGDFDTLMGSAIDISTPEKQIARAKEIQEQIMKGTKDVVDKSLHREYQPVGEPFPANEVPREDTPKCKIHKVRMTYFPDEDVAKCMESGCTRVAKKQRSLRDVAGAEVDSNPNVYRGALEFATDADGVLYLHLPGINAMISLAGMVGADQPDPQSPSSHPVNFFMGRIDALKTTAKETADRIKRRDQLSNLANESTARMRNRQPEVHGEMRIFGVSLPPHLCTVEASNAVARTFTQMQAKGIGKNATAEDMVSAAIEATYPSRKQKSHGEIQVLQYYTYKGVSLASEQVTENTDASLLEVCASTLKKLEEDEFELTPDEKPVYVMLDGRPLTRYGVSQYLTLEHQRARKLRALSMRKPY